MDMEQKTKFQIAEYVAWILAALIFLFVFGHFLIFIGICVAVRIFYIRYKNSKLGFIEPTNKAVLITGCDSGFGLALAKRLHKMKVMVIATCYNQNSDGRKELSQLTGDNVRIVELDVGKDESVSKCLRIVNDHCSDHGLWALVNNAGMNYMGDCELSTMAQYLEVANVNLFGMVRMCKAFLPLLRKAEGRIINVTSVKGLCAVPSNANYTITKYGGEAFSEIMRQEASQFNVKVSIIEPGNFGGITGCLDKAGQRRIKQLLDEMWEEASPEARMFYTKNHLETQMQECTDTSSSSYHTVEPVLDAFQDALFNHYPNVRYLVPGSSSFVDKYCFLARIYPYTPQVMFDKLRSFLFPYRIHRGVSLSPANDAEGEKTK